MAQAAPAQEEGDQEEGRRRKEEEEEEDIDTPAELIRRTSHYSRARRRGGFREASYFRGFIFGRTQADFGLTPQLTAGLSWVLDFRRGGSNLEI